MDMLGHDDPTILKMLYDFTGVDPKTIPLDDKETMAIFNSTNTLGVTKEQIESEVGTYGIPEFNTRYVRKMLQDTRPTTIEELIKISGLAHGTDLWIDNQQILVQQNIIKLKDTIATRDDIMLYLIKQGVSKEKSFAIMEFIRQGKVLKEKERWQEYVQIMKQHNIPKWYIKSCEKIRYIFPKAHATSYVINSFRIAWYKVHYPCEFYASYFSIKYSEELKNIITELTEGNIVNQIRNRKSITSDIYLEQDLDVMLEMYQRGIKFLPVDSKKSHSTKFIVEEAGIRIPLVIVNAESD